MQGDQALRRKLSAVLPLMNEKQRRILAAAEARSYGRGGIGTVARLSGISRQTIYRGLSELEAGVDAERVRAVGGGRKRLTEHQPDLVERLEALIEPSVRGDPQSPLRWTSLSTRKLEAALQQDGRQVSYHSVANLLHELDYTLQGNRKSSEGTVDHPQRDAQFRYIAEQASACLRRRMPVISVDTKKKELVGAYKNAGRDWRPKGDAIEVLTHDFPDPEVPKAVPYGVYDIGQNSGWVNVGMSADTAQFAVESIRQWWKHMGQARYPRARSLLICADSGGSNGYRLHLWKRELQSFATQQRFTITVCHFPPGTSKWNKIEHKLFCFITLNWRGRPLTDYRTIVSLIAATTTKAGLTVKARLDRKAYKRGIKVTAKEADSNFKPPALRRHADLWAARLPRGPTLGNLPPGCRTPCPAIRP
jgi:transposase